MLRKAEEHLESVNFKMKIVVKTWTEFHAKSFFSVLTMLTQHLLPAIFVPAILTNRRFHPHSTVPVSIIESRRLPIK